LLDGNTVIYNPVNKTDYDINIYNILKQNLDTKYKNLNLVFIQIDKAVKIKVLHLNNAARKKSNLNIKLNKLLLIGGDDTDLLPDSHPDCTSFSGDLSKIFYKSIVSNNIRFITARGLLSLSMRAISDMNFDLIHFLKEFFSDKEAVGVVADHVIFKDKSLKLISDFI
jgi:ribosomal protein S20